jgi:methoxymalonate biosynthesis acyl carrier protein
MHHDRGRLDRNQAIKDFILAQTPIEALGDDDDIFESGVVSSLFVMQLVSFVEREFSISIDGDDLSFDHFRNIRAIADLVARKSAAASAG